MTEYECILNTEVRKACENSDRQGIIREVVHKIRAQLPDVSFNNRKIGTHVHIAMGVVQRGGIFKLDGSEATVRRDDLVKDVLDSIHRAGKSSRKKHSKTRKVIR